MIPSTIPAGSTYHKTARHHPAELEAFRVWIVTPLPGPDPKTPGLTHSARWYAIGGDGAAWMVKEDRGGHWARFATEEEVAFFEDLPLVEERSIDEAIGVPAYAAWLASR